MVSSKCDIIIPVYKAPEWVKFCLYALFINNKPELINKVYLINDCDDPYTINCLKNLKIKYGNKIILKQNKTNLGFVKTVNYGLRLSTSDYVLLLNSDCLLAKNTLGKLINHLINNPKIGLICPLASNAANITIPIPEGWNYTQIDSLLETYFLSKNFDACTVVGNCLMLTKKCIEKVGLLDEAYGTGYGEETDYQFKAMAKGFQAKVAIDTYVFHKSEASFGTSQEKQERLQKNRDLFFSRWKKQYEMELKKYTQNDPVKYILTHLPKEAWRPKIKTLFYLDGILQNAGGVHTVVDIANYLTINGESVNIMYNVKCPYQEIILFNPISSKKIDDISITQIVSTVWRTAFDARNIANKKNAKLLSFIQGYESYFENGTQYGAVELSYKISNSILTVSKYLQKELKEVFNEKSQVIQNGINNDIISITKKRQNATPTITIIMRDNVMKGDWILADIIKKLNNLNIALNLNLISIQPKIILPLNTNDKLKINLITKPQDRNTIYRLLQKSDFYIDTSLSEGFGLTALEAMAAKCVPIVSNSMGVNEYLKDNVNGVIIKDVNNPDSYIKAIVKLIKNPDLLHSIIDQGYLTAKDYDIDKSIPLYSKYFSHPEFKETPNLSKYERKIIASMSNNVIVKNTPTKPAKVIKKIVPKPIRVIGIKIVTKLFNYINDNA